MNYSSLVKRSGAFLADGMITAFIGGGFALATGLWYTGFVSYNPASGMFILSDRGSSYGTFTESE